MTAIKKIGVFGSTGSIGTQTLNIARRNKNTIQVKILVANENVELLVQQAIEFLPEYVVIGNITKENFLKEKLHQYNICVMGGLEAIKMVAAENCYDFMIAAIIGYNGLFSVIEAIKNNKTIALANKESIVVAGNIITQLCIKNNVKILPLDSEHSAIFQCLMGEENIPNCIEKIILTASGGPFRGKKANFLMNVRREHALKHPIWKMGSKISIDSATLMNKGLEMIEAKWLFDLKPKQIEVLVHPQSIIHSIVCFVDGSMKAQLSSPSMEFPIQFALNYPHRIACNFEPVNFALINNLTLEVADLKTFRCLELAQHALAKGGNMPCILNTANEVAVDAFLNNSLRFLEIAEVVEETIMDTAFIENPTLDDYVNMYHHNKIIAEKIVKKKKIVLF